jgi:hypothetical protein
LTGAPINYANRLIGSPITSQSTDQASSCLTAPAFPPRQVRQHVATKGQPGWEQAANAAVLAWVDGTGPQPGGNLREELGGAAGVLRAIVSALLVAGAKSFTHMITALERYGPVLDALLREAGPAVRPRP